MKHYAWFIKYHCKLPYLRCLFLHFLLFLLLFFRFFLVPPCAAMGFCGRTKPEVAEAGGGGGGGRGRNGFLHDWVLQRRLHFPLTIRISWVWSWRESSGSSRIVSPQRGRRRRSRLPRRRRDECGECGECKYESLRIDGVSTGGVLKSGNGESGTGE